MTGPEGQPSPEGQPRTRQRIHRPPPALNVPNINDDAPERKRVLNVLAQRRYRQRKRQRKLGAASSSESSSAVRVAPGSSQATSATDIHHPTHEDEAAAQPDDSQADHDSRQAEAVVPYEQPMLGLDLQAAWSNEILDSIIPDLLGGDAGVTDPATSTGFLSPVPSFRGTEQAIGIDPTVLLSLSADAPSTEGSPSMSMSFPDTYLLPVPELKLLQAFLRIAQCINCKGSVWDLDAISPFNGPEESAPLIGKLPLSWRPTASQRTIPHHPLLDFLPWPSARDRLITIFDLPDDLRPPGVGGPLAIAQLAYDLEDGAEGMRIWGGSACDSSAWEVGQVLFERWWFIFDRQIVEQSNRWRRLRGAPTLKLSGCGGRVEDVSASVRPGT